ncbi:hypothetical protein MGG_10116 [Pyricularia oryzae 70-15]|uniref:H/ACA ribonucleoprotein complex non-core subunit NAF1 n=2 Tax=Pyricularia oryzae TaxID=318829 RepID=G4N8S8_PYRO7|nr:uncharacterized protein MGG_10116 [Pyricularia oryzae 70-15]EHA51074.1 hypothetical protein MGG_10116 [Pyricularia oryzae 70-15]KAI7917292.1 hypothetical protein M9X92_007454 [Pyricularia oryzae]
MSGGFVIPGLGEAKPNETLPVASFASEAFPKTGSETEQLSATNQAGDDKPATEDAMNVDSSQPPEPTHAAGTSTSAALEVNEDSMDVDNSTQGAAAIQAPAVAHEFQSDQSHLATAAPVADKNTTQTTANPRAEEANDSIQDSAHVTDALDAALLAMSQPKPEDLGPTTEAIVQAQAPITTTEPVAQEGAAAEWEADSSPYESSSDSSSSDDSSDDDSESGAMGLEETVRMLMANGDDSDADSDAGGDGKNGGKGRQVRSKNEQPDWVPPKPEVTITEDMEILPLGSILRIVGNTVLIQSGDDGEERVLDIETAVCRADRSIIAAIADVIGSVLRPMYILRFATSEDVEKEGLTTDMPVFYSPQHAQVVLTRALRQQKGYDASNLHDEEIPMEDQEFSDDEQEQAHKRQQKMKKKNNRGGARGGRGGAQSREMGSGHHGPSSGAAASADVGLNYDDDDDGPYKPLSRPANFGMGAPSSSEGATGNDRGGERDNFRDRGRGRGRGRGGFRGGRGGNGGGYSNGYSKQQQDRYPNYDQQQQQAPQSQPAAPYQWMPPPPPMTFNAGSQHAQQGGAAMPFAFPPFPPPAHQFGGNPPPAPPMGQHAPPVAPPVGQPQANWQAMAALYANPAFQQALRQAQQQQPPQGQPGWGQGPGAPR